MKYCRSGFRIRDLIILTGIFLLFSPFIGSAQQNTSKTHPEVAFASIIATDQTNTYFTADLTQLPAFFERAYLLELIFSDSKLVTNETNISGSTLELFASCEYDPEQIL